MQSSAVKHVSKFRYAYAGCNQWKKNHVSLAKFSIHKGILITSSAALAVESWDALGDFFPIITLFLFLLLARACV